MAKEALGRGLGALLGEIEEAYDNEMPSRGYDIKELSLNDIKPNPFQPRKTFDSENLAQLAESIKDHGLIQPITVVQEDENYILVAGERRWRASRLAKTKTIRAIVVSVSEEEMREHALIENIQREELNIIELAFAYEELINIHNLTHEQLAKMIHKSRTHITNTLRLLQLNKKVQKALIDGKVTMGHTKVMIGLSDKDQILVMNSVVGQKLSVREVETMVKGLKNEPESKVTSPTIRQHYDFSELYEKLAKIGLDSNAKSNKLTINFKSSQDLELLIKALG
ncbi:MAG: ParB/RepB/Spo0J family partition protein [Campylobacterota bacterium]|nr:ParB/RepB/Spo0J family partition protein [Campylobacterota bacterium]